MSIVSVNRVAMRKLSSSKIFDLYIDVQVPKYTDNDTGLDLSSLNSKISRTFSILFGWEESLINNRLGELARAGHIHVMTYTSGWGRVTKKYILNLYGGTLEFYISVDGNNLSEEDLEEVLKYGLEISKWESYFKEVR